MLKMIETTFLILFIFPMPSGANSSVHLNLSSKINTAILSEHSKNSLTLQGFVIIEDVVRYFTPKNSSREVGEEVLTYLQNHHLRLGMTDAEIAFYNDQGRAPAISELSSIRVLNISYRTVVALENAGVRTLADAKKWTTRQMLSLPWVGPVGVKQIQKALETLESRSQRDSCAEKL